MNLKLTVLILLASLMLFGCTNGKSWSPHPARVIYEPTDKKGHRLPEPERKAKPTTGSAGSLYRKAEDYLTQGNYTQAELAMERALRVEPRNSYYWYTLARIKYAKKQYTQAVQLSLKSKSMAGNNRQLIDVNNSLIEKAKKSGR